MPNTHRRRDSTVELSRVGVGGVYAPVVSRDPVSIFLRQSHIGCRIVNWVTTADGCVHTADTTQLDSTRQDKFSTCSVSKFSSACSRRELVANSIHTADADTTQIDSWVASAVCIGHNVDYYVASTVWVKKKSPPTVFWNFFQNGWEFLINFLHTYYTIISTLDYKFLFKYLQLWQSYVILSATT